MFSMASSLIKAQFYSKVFPPTVTHYISDMEGGYCCLHLPVSRRAGKGREQVQIGLGHYIQYCPSYSS